MRESLCQICQRPVLNYVHSLCDVCCLTVASALFRVPGILSSMAKSFPRPQFFFKFRLLHVSVYNTHSTLGLFAFQTWHPCLVFQSPCYTFQLDQLREVYLQVRTEEGSCNRQFLEWPQLCGH